MIIYRFFISIRSENTSLADRSKLWEQQRQQKILRERQENQDKELEGCTFKPQLQVDLVIFHVFKHIARKLEANLLKEFKILRI